MKRIKNLIKSFLFFIICPVFADNIEWEAVKGAVGYEFQMVDKDGKVVQENKNLTVNKIEVTISIPGEYKYKIGVVDKEGSLVYSNWESYTIEDLSLGEGKEFSAHIEWQEVPKATSYYLEINTSTGKLVKAYKTKNLFKDVELKKGKYQYRVAQEVKGKKTWSEWTEIEVKPPVVPPKPLLSDRTKFTLQSIALPGWGQKSRGDRPLHVYSYIFFMVPLAALYVSRNGMNTKAEKNYNNSINLQMLAFLSNDASSTNVSLLMGFQAISARGEVNSSYSAGRNFSYILAGVYLLNIVDAYFFHNYNKEPNTKTTSFDFQMYDKKPTVNGNFESGFSLGWNYRF